MLIFTDGKERLLCVEAELVRDALFDVFVRQRLVVTKHGLKVRPAPQGKYQVEHVVVRTSVLALARLPHITMRVIATRCSSYGA